MLYIIGLKLCNKWLGLTTNELVFLKNSSRSIFDQHMARIFILLIPMLGIVYSSAANDGKPAVLKLGAEKKYEIPAYLYKYVEGPAAVSPQLSFRFF